jgi:hypothetical protein
MSRVLIWSPVACPVCSARWARLRCGSTCPRASWYQMAIHRRGRPERGIRTVEMLGSVISPVRVEQCLVELGWRASFPEALVRKTSSQPL